jgi:hypothetical protein
MPGAVAARSTTFDRLDYYGTRQLEYTYDPVSNVLSGTLPVPVSLDGRHVPTSPNTGVDQAGAETTTPSLSLDLQPNGANYGYDPATGQFLSVDPAVDATGQPYAYAGDDPVNRTDPSGLWWCLPQGYAGPCPPGYTPGPPYAMSNPQPPKSQVQSQGSGTYLLTLSDGETETYKASGQIVGNEGLATGQAPCNPNSPTTNQEWNQYLANLYPDDSGGGLPWYLNGMDTLNATGTAYDFISNHMSRAGSQLYSGLFNYVSQNRQYILYLLGF